jgi:hypothetical protein
MNNVNQKKTYAKDPIDFIRNFRFAAFQQNTGSSAGPTRTDHDLVIRISNEVYAGTTEVMIHHTQFRAAEYVASWLEKHPGFSVMPFAYVSTFNNSTMIDLSILPNVDVGMSLIKTSLERLIAHVSEVAAQTKNNDCTVIRASYDPKPGDNNNNGGYGYVGPGQVIGKIVLDDPRTPVHHQSRLPQGSTGNNNNW